MKSYPVIGNVEPDEAGLMLHTRYDRFESSIVAGLARVDGDRLNLLAVTTRVNGKGHFREFIRQAKEHYKTICVWHVENKMLAAALIRYGFEPEIEPQGDGEILHGLRWDKK